MLYFLAFGLSFGWPLLVLPLVATPLQRGLTRGLAGNAHLITRGAGVILIAMALVGLWVEVLPNLAG